MGKLIPIMIEAVRPPAGFREIQAADLTNWDGSREFEGLRMLLADLEKFRRASPFLVQQKIRWNPSIAGTPILARLTTRPIWRVG